MDSTWFLRQLERLPPAGGWEVRGEHGVRDLGGQVSRHGREFWTWAGLDRRSQGEGTLPGVLAECARWGLAHGEGWGGTLTQNRRQGWRVRMGGVFGRVAAGGKAEGGVAHCGLTRRSAEVSAVLQRDLHSVYRPGYEWRVAGGRRWSETGGQARPGGATETRGEAGAWGRAGTAGRWAPCQHPALQGPWEGGVQMPGQRQEREEVRNRGEGRLGKPPGHLPCRPSPDASLGCSLGLPGGWWGVPASSSSAVETGPRCAGAPSPAAQRDALVSDGVSSGFLCLSSAVEVGFMPSRSVPLHLEVRSPWRGTRLPSASRPAGATSREDSLSPPAVLGGVCPHQGRVVIPTGNLRRGRCGALQQHQNIGTFHC